MSIFMQEVKPVVVYKEVVALVGCDAWGWEVERFGTDKGYFPSRGNWCKLSPVEPPDHDNYNRWFRGNGWVKLAVTHDCTEIWGKPE